MSAVIAMKMACWDTRTPSKCSKSVVIVCLVFTVSGTCLGTFWLLAQYIWQVMEILTAWHHMVSCRRVNSKSPVYYLYQCDPKQQPSNRCYLCEAFNDPGALAWQGLNVITDFRDMMDKLAAVISQEINHFPFGFLHPKRVVFVLSVYSYSSSSITLYMMYSERRERPVCGQSVQHWLSCFLWRTNLFSWNDNIIILLAWETKYHYVEITRYFHLSTQQIKSEPDWQCLLHWQSNILTIPREFFSTHSCCFCALVVMRCCCSTQSEVE